MAVVISISQQIWDMKYRLKGPVGEPLDKTIEDTWRRVATALAATERDPALCGERFYAAMSDFKFLPAGRVVAGAGSGLRSRRVRFGVCSATSVDRSAPTARSELAEFILFDNHSYRNVNGQCGDPADRSPDSPRPLDRC